MVAHSKDNTLTDDHRSFIKPINTKQKLSTAVIPRRIRSKKRTKRKLWTLNEEEDNINNNDTQRLHQNAITSPKDTQNPHKKPKTTTKPSSKWNKHSKSSRKSKRKRVRRISYKDLCDENGNLIIGAIHSSKSQKTNIITKNKANISDKHPSIQTNHDHETLQSKKCHERRICNGKMVKCHQNRFKSRPKSEPHIKFRKNKKSRHRRSKSEEEIFQEKRQRDIERMIRETFQNSVDSSDDEQQQIIDAPSSAPTSPRMGKHVQHKKTLDGNGKIVVESRLKTNIESSWRITIGDDMKIDEDDKENQIIFGVEIVDKRQCYTIYGNDKGVIKMDGKEIEEGIKLEKGMEILIDIEYVNQPKSMVMMRFTYLKRDKMWREESEQIVIDGLIPYSYGVEGDVFVAQSEGAFATYTIERK